MAAPTKIAFLIDEQSIITSKVQLDYLKLSIMRILLFYRSRQQQILWGYRFFSTQTRYTTNSIRHFYTMDKDSFIHIDTEYQKRNADRPDTTVTGTPIMRIKQVLKEAIGDFQWENTDLCTTDPVKNYIFLLTACPSDGNDMHRFFVKSVDEEDVRKTQSTIASFEISQHFQQVKEELTTTLLQSYKQHHISLNVIDTDYKFLHNNPRAQLMDRLIQQGFISCFEQFGGTYILYQKLIRKNDIYGHSFFSEFANILPSRQGIVHSYVPAWKGPFKTKLGKSLGNFALYTSLRGANYQSSTLAFITEIRTVNIVHASQFSVSWLLKENVNDATVDYKLTYQEGESCNAFNIILDELFATQSILIAEMVPLVGFEDLARRVCIEPYSRCSASLRFLNIDKLPPTLSLKNVLVEDDYPIGTYLASTKLRIEFPEAPLPPEDRSYKLFTTLPDFIAKLNIKDKTSTGDLQIEDLLVKTPEMDVEPIAKKEIQLPSDVDMMGKALKKIYLDTLYTQRASMDNTIIHINKCVDHLLKNDHSRQDIISTIFDYTMPLADLDIKHHNEIPNAKKVPSSGNCTLEQSYQYQWWQKVKSKHHTSPDFERMSCVALKLREAQLQVINYCFICKLIDDPKDLEIYKRDPFEEARNFFSKVVVIFSMNDDISDFLTGLDSEEGTQAAQKRDPCDLSDHAFAQVLGKRFHELSDLVAHFKDCAGADDMASPSSLDFEDDFAEHEEQQQPSQPPPPPPPPPSSSSSSSSKRPVITSRTASDTRIVKPYHPPQKSSVKPSQSLKLESKSAKSFMPQKMTKSSSNTLDSFYKRMVNVTPSVTTGTESRRGEATNESIAKMKRAAVHGRPTMKRAGSFTKSALSPRRPNRAVSMLAQAPQETGTVILRRDNSIPNPETTPRTSLNRYLGTNLFADYSEACLSPSSKTSPTTDASYVQSEYPQAPKTPQGTSSRFRKIMMDRTPHRHDDESDQEEFSVTLNSQENLPPYTPRTAARRERDRIDRSQIMSNPGRNLTMKFQNIRQEEEKERNMPIIKRKRNLFDEDDDEDDDDENDDEQENVNPFAKAVTSTTTASRPVVKRSKTFDFNDLFNNALETPAIQFGEQFGGIDDDDDDDDSDDNELDVTFGTSNQQRALY